MINYKKSLSALAFVLCGSFLLVGEARADQNWPAPVIVSPTVSTVTAKPKPIMIGLAKSGSVVHIYIDGVYNGKTERLFHVSGTANFAYMPFLNLNRGYHSFWAVAEDAAGNKSAKASDSFTIELPMPAPTLIAPRNEAKFVNGQNLLLGLAKNDSQIKVFVDKKLYGQFKVRNHISGTANFYFKPQGLTRGAHIVYTTATDARGKESQWSGIRRFAVIEPRISSIVSTVADENVKTGTRTAAPAKQPTAAPKKTEPPKEPTAVEPEKSAENKPEPAEVATSASIDKTDNEPQTGTVNEQNGSQNNISFNLIIFIAFLGGIITWIIWINRELIREKKDGKKDAEPETTDEKDIK